MTTTCPDGHASDAADYCSVCGKKIDAAATPAAKPAAGDKCSNCEAPRDANDKFCEVCGYDFVSGTLPATPPAAATPQAAAPAPPAASAPANTDSPWWAVVSADRGFYDRNQTAEVQFPLGAAERTFQLTAERVTIGRRSASRGVAPVIDLAEAPEDAAVSHGHATLLRQTDGTYCLVDNDSTNGTYVNGSADPTPANTPVPLGAGDHFNLGAWTRVTIENRGALHDND